MRVLTDGDDGDDGGGGDGDCDGSWLKHPMVTL